MVDKYMYILNMLFSKNKGIIIIIVIIIIYYRSKVLRLRIVFPFSW